MLKGEGSREVTAPITAPGGYINFFEVPAGQPHVRFLSAEELEALRKKANGDLREATWDGGPPEFMTGKVTERGRKNVLNSIRDIERRAAEAMDAGRQVNVRLSHGIRELSPDDAGNARYESDGSLTVTVTIEAVR
jgi:hypothetical protein